MLSKTSQGMQLILGGRTASDVVNRSSENSGNAGDRGTLVSASGEPITTSFSRQSMDVSKSNERLF